MYTLAKFLAKTLLLYTSEITLLPPDKGNSAIIAFAGTQNAKDVIFDDLSILPQRWPYFTTEVPRVHGGFAKRTRKLLERSSSFIDKYDNYILTGHSLGGSCAILAASELKSRGKNVSTVITFGCPGVGLNSFIKYYITQDLWDKTYNYYTYNDIIFHLPNVYKHVGNLLYLESFTDNSIENHDLYIYYHYLCLNEYIKNTY